MMQDDSRREALSAMADGEAMPAEADALCDAWRLDPAVRGRWHAYHLIGDALRSDDLAGAPARDEAFLQLLRSRMALEPVILAPAVASLPRAGRSWMRWAAPAAVAAGFVVVAGVLVVARQAGPQPADAPVVAQTAPRSAPAATLVSSGGAVPALEPVPVITAPNPVMIRDARLDRYLAAHRGAGEGVALMVPGGAVRRADVVLAGPGQ